MTSREQRAEIAAVSAQAKKEADAIVAAITAADIEVLRAAVVVLAERVTSLSDALMALNEIQRRQTETERKTAAIEQVMVPREEHERKEKAHTAREDKIQTRTTLGAIITAIVVLVGSLSLAHYYKEKQDASYRLCVDRNQQSRAFAVYVRDQSKIIHTTRLSPAQLDAFDQAAMRFEKSFPTSNCTALH